MLTMCALLVCLFVISASADELVLIGLSDNPSLVGNYASHTISYSDGPDSSYKFAVHCYMSSDMDGTAYYINPYEFQKWCKDVSGKENLSYDEFKTYISASDDEGSESVASYWSSDYNGFNEEYFNALYNYKSITQEDFTAQYNQGKTDGVTEFKESEEYTNILSSKYEEGKTDGAEAFKSSDEYSQELQAEYTKGYGVGYEAYKDSAEYESALNTQFNLGSSTGVKNYLESEEYSNALQNEYDNGYEAATTEDNQKRAKNMLGTALGISGALIIVLLCVYFFVGRKARKRR